MKQGFILHIWSVCLEMLLGHLGSSNYKELGLRPGIETKHHAMGAAIAHLSICSEESRMSDYLQWPRYQL
jgi:hypothetical protein